MAVAGYPFALPERDEVTKIPHRDTAKLRHPGGERTQSLSGFEDDFTDIVDYILRITEQIWVDRGVGRIYDTYDASCVVYSALGVVRSVEDVVVSTLQGINATADGESHHLNIAWCGDDQQGFYTSHLGFAYSTNSGPTLFGPATGRRIGRFFVADCISRDNRIHTEWLMRDNGAAVRQMGFDPHVVARRLAETPLPESPFLSVPTRLEGQAIRKGYTGTVDTPQDWIEHHFSTLWNMRRFDHLADHYAPGVIAHWAGGRTAHGRRNLQALIISLLASLPTSTVRVENVCWAEETDGLIVAVRWTLEGTTRAGGLLGDVPAGRPVSIMGSSHFRFGNGLIVEEWTVFDEIGALMQAYRS
jgi:SnoaL-like polyketide cyclase